MPWLRHVQERVGSSSTYRSGPSCLFPVMRFAAVHHNKKAAENQHGSCSRQPHDVGDYRAVSSGCWIVVIAVEQHLVHDGSNLVLRRLNQTQANVLGRELDAVIVLSNLSRWRHDHDGRGMDELSGAWIAAVMKSGRVGKLLDLRLLAGQEVPAIAIGLVFQMLVHARDVNLLLLCRILGSLVRVEAYRDNFVFIPRGEPQRS